MCLLKTCTHVVQADNLKAPSAANAGRLAGKEDLYMKKAVKRYIDHCRWKEVSEVTDQNDEDEQEVAPDAEMSEEEPELEVDDFADSEEDEVAREARLERKENRKKVEEFEERARHLSRLEKRNAEFVDER